MLLISSIYIHFQDEISRHKEETDKLAADITNVRISDGNLRVGKTLRSPTSPNPHQVNCIM